MAQFLYISNLGRHAALGGVVAVTKEQIEPYKEFVRPYYTTRDPAHDLRHIERIISRLDLLSEGVSWPPRRDRLYFLACFHGLG